MLNKKNKGKEYQFILTTFENLATEFQDVKYRGKNVVVGLSNGDFILNSLEIGLFHESGERERAIESHLEDYISGYSPVDYVTRTLVEEMTDYSEEVMGITISREKIRDIIEAAKASKIKLCGIYPSFMLDDQHELKEILAHAPSIHVEESLVDVDEFEELGLEEESSLGTEKTALVLTENGHPLNLRKRIIQGEELYYNFLDPFERDEIDKAGIFDKVVGILAVVFLLQLLFFGYLEFDKYRITSKLNAQAQKNSQTNSRIKTYENKIAQVPNFAARIQMVENIIKSRQMGVSKLLSFFENAKPEGLYLENISVEKDRIVMSGHSKTLESVYDFQRSILQRGDLVLLPSPITGGDQFFKFNIEAKFR